MESYWVKHKKYTKNIDPRVLGLVMVKQWYYQNFQRVVVKNQDLLKMVKK